MRAQGRGSTYGAAERPPRAGRARAHRNLRAAGARQSREEEGRGSQRAARAGRKEDGPAWPTRGKRRKEGRESWASGGFGPWEEREGERGPTGRDRREVCWVGPLSIPFLFLHSTHSNKPHLNSNKFEFKSNKLNTRTIMLQHECTNNFDPMINFNYLRYKITLNTR
jgi:hypothetical protein